MKNFKARKVAVVLFALTFQLYAYSQCLPDTENCIDTDEPGQMCPSNLPDGYLGEYYDQVITILTPESGNVGELNINIHKLRLESVENLPAGITYHSATNEFFAGESYCIQLKGTPILAGTYKLKITVTPFVRILGVPVPWGKYVDSTSVVMNIAMPAYINDPGGLDFSLINAYPNPFNSTTRIGFYEIKGAETELRVFDLSGKQVHYENMEGSIGENYFDFTGQALRPGFYLYSVVRENEKLIGRIVKCY